MKGEPDMSEKGRKKQIPCLGIYGITRMLIVVLYFTIVSVTPARAQTGVYTLNGGTATQTGQTYAATLTDQSAVYVLNSGNLTLNNCTMTKTGDASNVNNSSQYGINAGVLANSAGIITISGGSVTTNATGANGLFASGSGSAISMSNGTINASGNSSHGVDVTYGGSMTLDSVNVTTNGESSSALATDFGGGTVTVTGGTIIASSTSANSHSAGIYSTGTISVTGATVSSVADCGGVIDGANSIILTNTSLTGNVEGIKLWKTAPANGTATVTISGGSLTSTAGDAFYVTGETGNAASGTITLSGGAVISAGTGNILNVISSSAAILTAEGETLNGNLVATGGSTITAALQNSTSLTGMINAAALSLDATSTWTLAGNSILTTVTDPSGISGLSVTNITGNGFSAHYDSTLPGNLYLGGKTYSLVNGGYLTPGIVHVGVQQLTGNSRQVFELDQNYPNPFSCVTDITFEIRQPSMVILTICNMIGQPVKVLDKGTIDAGTYTEQFNASGLASGIYYYRLSVDGATQTKKMIVD
jgi:hypothetical protein